MSYAALSTLSVDTLLTSNVQELEKKYMNAMETQHRVRIYNLQNTVVGLQNVSSTLSNFQWVVETFSASVLQRVNKALFQLHQMAYTDIKNMTSNMLKYKQAIDQIYTPKLDLSLSMIETLTDNCIYILAKSSSMHNNSFTQRPQLKYVYEAVSAHAHMLGDSLMWLTQFNNLSVPADIKPYLPVRIWANKDRKDYCEKHLDAMYLETNEFTNSLVNLLQTTSYNFADHNNTVFSFAKLILSHMNETTSCLKEYTYILDSVLSLYQTTITDLTKIMKTGMSFSYMNVIDTMGDELRYMANNQTWINSLLTNYSKNVITKRVLSDQLNNAIMVANEKTIDTIISKINLHAFTPLRHQTEILKQGIIDWYHDINVLLKVLTGYFDNDNIEGATRNMTIWRHPEAELDTADILIFQLPKTQTWRTWARSRTLGVFVGNGEDKEIITSILTVYMNTLYDELYRVEAELRSAKSHVLLSMTEIITSLEEYKTTSKIDKDFVM